MPIRLMAMALLIAMVLPFFLNAQNVGIGTTDPLVQLHINANNPTVARFDGTGPMNIQFYEDGINRGYLGSISGTSSSVDFGTSASNNTGSLHLTIQTVPALTISTQGMVGIGTQNPGQMLELASGNLKLNNSPLGIIMNGADRPMITRSFDPFTSGIYSGIGRWGLFMEGNRLTLGMPNIGGKGVNFSRYNNNSTVEPLMTVTETGEINRPGTGNADLIPVCMGSVQPNGTILGGTGNFSVQSEVISGNPVGSYIITIQGIAIFDLTNYIVVANSIPSSTTFTKTYPTLGISSGKLNITTNAGQTMVASGFHFVVYKL